MQKPQLRIAPTPSGYLHLGNVMNFMLVQQLALELGAEITLRIDDLDASRAREPYLAFIFEVLNHLNIHWHHGPKGLTETAEHSQWTRMQEYWHTLQVLSDRQLLYPCSCTRQELEAWRRHQNQPGTTTCPCFRNTQVSTDQFLQAIGTAPSSVQMAKPQAVAWRLHPELKRKVAFGSEEVWSWPDVPPVMFRKEGLPAYHLASVTDDVGMGTTHIVRGHDLLESSATQVVLAQALGLSTYLDVNYLHHGLLNHAGIMGEESAGMKLSKSAGANAQAALPTSKEVELLMSCVSTIMQAKKPFVAVMIA